MSLIPRNLVERKAGRIQDPIERLRYLNQRMGSLQEKPKPATRKLRNKWGGIALGVLMACLLIPRFQGSSTRASALAPITESPVTAAAPPPSSSTAVNANAGNVWLVDKTGQLETYSNGLRIDNRFAVSNQNRLFYPVYKRANIDASQPEWRSEPAGIVYHTTESDQARFDPDQNRELKRIGHEVLAFVRRNRCYHFLIDRFGQVFRVVQESDGANHAGNSIWADDSVIYVNLNSSFLGVAFETQTQRGEDLPSANPAQIHAARTLTEMLRSKYHIPALNCVTHAQVSVNPLNMRIGYHTDWSGNFPFQEIGLNDNYPTPPPAIFAFGFDYDPVYVHATGVRIWQGLALAENQIRTDAAARGLTPSEYRLILRKKYKEVAATLKALSAAKETTHGAE